MTLEQTHECPVCENIVDSLKLESKGLSFADLLEIKQYVKEGILVDILRLGNITRDRLKNSDNNITLEGGFKNLENVIRDVFPMVEELRSVLDTNKADNKGSMLEAVDSLRGTINQLNGTVSNVVTEVAKGREELGVISKRLGGTTIGITTEGIILKELKSACPLDNFSDDQSKAPKHGTDIIGTVIDKQRKCGRISISVKNTEKWASGYMDQLLQNMKQDGTQIGILATKSFPTEAIGEKMYVPHIINNPTRGIIIVVKLESVSLAYFALRQFVIYTYETEELQNLKKETDDAIETVQALIGFYNGPDFKAIISDTTEAIEGVKKTKEELTSVINNLEKSIDRQDGIEKKLNHAKDMIEKKIREILYH